MRLPQLLAGTLVARQAVQLLPSLFCSPECREYPSSLAIVGTRIEPQLILRSVV
jgi:hypothetical protein